MPETPEAQIAVLNERFRVIMEALRESKQEARECALSLSNVTRSIDALTTRITSVEDSLAKNAPTIEEFITIKHKVVGAGILGKWVWMALGGVIGFIFAARGYIIELMTLGKIP